MRAIRGARHHRLSYAEIRRFPMGIANHSADISVSGLCRTNARAGPEMIILFKGTTMTDLTSITSGTLIAAEKVNGTSVYNPAGEKLGSVDDIMLDKVSGRAIYAVMSFGGFLGVDKKHHPLPCSTLKYDPQ